MASTAPAVYLEDDPPWTREHLPCAQALQQTLLREESLRTRPHVNHQPPPITAADPRYWNRHHPTTDHQP